MSFFNRSASGFTLAELLIALAILGVIATFTIPKVLSSATSGQNTSVAKEAASMVSGAFASYQLANSLASGTTADLLTNYMNYVSIDTSSTTYGFTDGCNTSRCLKLHNGGVLQYKASNSFGGTTTTHAILFNIDPDGAGSTGAATFVQYYNGRLTTYQVGNAAPGVTTTGAPTAIATDPAYIQNWN